MSILQPILRPVLGPVLRSPLEAGGGGAAVPATALLDSNGAPILDSDGNYILEG